jgi:hypothetical protein
VVLRAVGQHDLRLRPVGVVGKQNGLAELDATEPVKSRLIGTECQFQAFAELLNLGFQDLLYELSGADRMDLFFHRIQGGGFAALHLAFAAALQLGLQVAQFPPRLA